MNMTQTGYCVIGGQYVCRCYGFAPTLLGAKRLAHRCEEYWDNWQGWHIPAIYLTEDTVPCENFYGEERCPVEGAAPVAIAQYENGRVVWYELTEAERKWMV